MIKIILLTGLLLTGFMATAQIEKIDTDRPDQTESVFIVPRKYIQIEAGFVAEKQNIYFHNYTAPTILSKYGLSKKTEFRLITEYEASNSKLYTIGETSITTPLQLGFKTALWEEKGLLPKTSFIFHTALQNIDYSGQNGSRTTKEIACNYRLTLQNTITKNIGLGYNIGMEWERMSETPAYVYTIATGFNLGEKWYTYVEAFGAFVKNEAPDNNLDAGIAYYVTDNFKLDISAGIGISENAPPNYFAVGVSFRFKTGK
jgi:hypothetical protein